MCINVAASNPNTSRRRAAALRTLQAGLLALGWLLLAISTAGAQEWAVKMFESTNHEFGTVARGTKAQARFKLKNVYEEDVHVINVRSSCGCTSALIEKPHLKTYETGEIVADFNTADFLGAKNATLTVTFSKPFPAEVQLHVAGFIRSDITVQPGVIDFGSVDFGAGAEKHLSISYAGRDDWQLVDAKSVSPHLEVQMLELSRGRGQVSYDLTVRLTGDAPVGYLRDQLILVSNDAKAADFPVEIRGQVVSEITVSPSSLFLGVVEPGQKVTKQVIVRGKRPFKIVKVNCSDKRFTISPDEEEKAVHLLPVVFVADDKAGKVTRAIALETDQEGLRPTFNAYVQVTEGKVARTSAEVPVESPPAATPLER